MVRQLPLRILISTYSFTCSPHRYQPALSAWANERHLSPSGILKFTTHPVLTIPTPLPAPLPGYHGPYTKPNMAPRSLEQDMCTVYRWPWHGCSSLSNHAVCIVVWTDIFVKSHIMVKLHHLHKPMGRLICFQACMCHVRSWRTSWWTMRRQFVCYSHRRFHWLTR